MKNLIFIYFSIIILIFTFSFTGEANAQTNQLLQTPVNLELIPENPGANQTVTAKITSFGTDLDSASIRWTLNGKVLKSGKGEKSVTFVTGSINTTSTLTVSIVTQGGEEISKVYSIKPTEVDLIWETDGSKPPFYKGKALFSHQGNVRFIAMPHMMSSGSEVAASKLVYKWSKNGSVDENASGYGKNVYSVNGSIISRGFDVSVEVTNPTNDATGFAQTSLAPNLPFILFYEKNPLYGIQYQNALTGNVKLTGSKEIQIVAEPYFFSSSVNYSPELTYKWSINGTNIDSDTSQTSRTFRQVEGTRGVSLISVSIENARQLLQSASSGFNLEFGSNTTQ